MIENNGCQFTGQNVENMCKYGICDEENTSILGELIFRGIVKPEMIESIKMRKAIIVKMLNSKEVVGILGSGIEGHHERLTFLKNLKFKSIKNNGLTEDIFIEVCKFVYPGMAYKDVEILMNTFMDAYNHFEKLL